MSFYQSSQWSTYYQGANPQNIYTIRKYSNNDISTRKGSTDSCQIKYKTEVCKYWLNNQYCPFQNLCTFAHGFNQMRDKSHAIEKYKTKSCKRFKLNGYCTYGMRCQFVHEQTYKIQDKFQKIQKMAEMNEQLFNLYLLSLNLKRLNIFKYVSKYDELKELFGGNSIETEQIFNVATNYGFKKQRFYSM